MGKKKLGHSSEDKDMGALKPVLPVGEKYAVQ
jgi:hypothetical protein